MLHNYLFTDRNIFHSYTRYICVYRPCSFDTPSGVWTVSGTFSEDEVRRLLLSWLYLLSIGLSPSKHFLSMFSLTYRITIVSIILWTFKLKFEPWLSFIFLMSKDPRPLLFFPVILVFYKIQFTSVKFWSVKFWTTTQTHSQL